MTTDSTTFPPADPTPRALAIWSCVQRLEVARGRFRSAQQAVEEARNALTGAERDMAQCMDNVAACELTLNAVRATPA